LYLQHISRLKKEELFPDAREFIENAHAEGYGIALGSASKNSRLILERLKITDLFDVVVDGTVVSKAKPDPEVFLEGARRLELLCPQCLVFEDAAAGIEAAHAAGMMAVGVGAPERLPLADINIGGFQDISIDNLMNIL
jgi:beta-phosphoglucomutase